MKRIISSCLLFIFASSDFTDSGASDGLICALSIYPNANFATSLFFQWIAFAYLLYQSCRFLIYGNGSEYRFSTAVRHGNYFFIEIWIDKYLIISVEKKMLITGAITACSCNTLKPKALPRRARGKNRTCPVPSCSILQNRLNRQVKQFLLNWGDGTRE